MKYLRFTTCCLLAALVSFAAGCSNDDSDTPGGGGGEGSAITIAAKHALGSRTENAAEDNSNSYRIVMSATEITGTAEAPKLTGAGQFVTILLYAAEQQANTLPEGTYTLVDGKPAAGQGDLNACRLETANAQGSAGANLQILLGGTVKVSHTAAGYKIELAGQLSGQRTLGCTYEGAIDFGEKPGPTPTYDVEIDAKFALGLLASEVTEDGASDFYLALSDIEMDGDAENPFFGEAGQYMHLDFCAIEREPGILPEGTYHFTSDMPADMTGMIDYCDYNTTDEMGEPSPEPTLLTECSATVSYTDDGYRIEATGKFEGGRTFRVSYEGMIEFEDGGGGEISLPGLKGNVQATFTLPEAAYHGVTEEGTAHYTLELSDNDFDQNFITTNTLKLDLYTEATDTPLQIKAGTYSVEGSQFAGTLMPGRFDMDRLMVDGTHVEQYYVAEDDYSLLYGMVQEGTVTIEYADGQYTVTADLVDADGNTIKGSFTGTFTVANKSVFSNLKGDREVNLTGMPCDIEYYADLLGVRGDNWFVFIGTQADGTEALRIDLVAPMAGFAGGLPAGEYQVDKLTNFNDNLLCVPGLTDGFNLEYSWYMGDYQDGWVMSQAPFTTGKVIVGRSGDQYTITLDIYDDNPVPNHITGSWTGVPTVLDKSAGQDDPRAASRKFAPTRVAKGSWPVATVEQPVKAQVRKSSRWQ